MNFVESGVASLLAQTMATADERPRLLVVDAQRVNIQVLLQAFQADHWNCMHRLTAC